MTSTKLEAKARLTAASVDLAQCKELYTRTFKLFAADPDFKGGTQKINGAPSRNSMIAFEDKGWGIGGHVCMIGSSGGDVDGNPAEKLEQPTAKLKTLAADAVSLLEKAGFKVMRSHRGNGGQGTNLGFVAKGFVCEASVNADWSIAKTKGSLGILLLFYSTRSKIGKEILTKVGGAK